MDLMYYTVDNLSICMAMNAQQAAIPTKPLNPCSATQKVGRSILADPGRHLRTKG